MSYQDSVLPVLRSMREELMDGWGTAPVIAQKDDSAVNVVTEADVRVEAAVAAELAKRYPDIAFVGEEGGGEVCERFWLMDPIDGTAHYVRGLPFSTTMLSLIENGEVRFGAIYDFVHDRMYHAEKGRGAFMNGEPIRVRERSLAASYFDWESRIEKADNLALMERLWGKTILMHTICAGWAYAMIASGKLDGRINVDPYGKDYDYAPGSLLVAEAGGVVANIGSTTYDYRNHSFIAANPAAYRDLTEGPDALFPVES